MRVKSLDELRSNRGMTLGELMAVMVILSVVTVLTGMTSIILPRDIYVTGAGVYLTQQAGRLISRCLPKLQACGFRAAAVNAATQISAATAA